MGAAPRVAEAISSTGAGTDGANHWSYAGYRDLVVPALVKKTKL